MFDVDFARRFFPALSVDDWAFFDNAGGSLTARPVIDRVTGFLSRYGVQVGASYPRSQEVSERLAAGRRAAAELVAAEPDEIVLGASTTMNVYVLAQAFAAGLAPGDEIVVTNLDHEANVGAWRRLEERGVRVREWRHRPETVSLEIDDLDRLLTDRTRLVCFTHCANVVGAVHDAATICRRVREAGAASCVDGVAFGPHRKVDVETIGADFYLLSLYKIFGPHQGLLFGRREQLLRLRGQNHFLVGEDEIPYKLQPGNVTHELAAAVPGMIDYLEALDRRHDPDAGGDRSRRLARAFERIAEWEEELVRPLLDFLGQRAGVRILGPSTADRRQRVATIAFALDGRRASDVPSVLERHRVAVRCGHFYAYRALEALGLLTGGGVVRVSLAHYNTPEEVDRLLVALDEALG